MRSPRPLDALLAALPEYVLAPEGIAVGVAVTAVEHDSRIVGPGLAATARSRGSTPTATFTRPLR